MEYKELLKMIHPDLNPTITNPGDKITLCKLYKNDPSKLVELAIMWGLIPDPKKVKVEKAKAEEPGKPKTGYKGPYHRTTTTNWSTDSKKYDYVYAKLNPNTIYNNGVTGYHKKKFMWFPIIKTTNKQVYYHDTVDNVYRRCDITTIIQIRKMHG